jgi:ferredoxin
MADKKDKWPKNAKGKFYVDRTCIACDACCIAAPDNFKMDEEDGHALIAKQPSTPQEEEQCKEAMEGCPVEAIGPDGEE